MLAALPAKGSQAAARDPLAGCGSIVQEVEAAGVPAVQGVQAQQPGQHCAGDGHESDDQALLPENLETRLGPQRVGAWALWAQTCSQANALTSHSHSHSHGRAASYLLLPLTQPVLCTDNEPPAFGQKEGQGRAALQSLTGRCLRGVKKSSSFTQLCRTSTSGSSSGDGVTLAIPLPETSTQNCSAMAHGKRWGRGISDLATEIQRVEGCSRAAGQLQAPAQQLSLAEVMPCAGGGVAATRPGWARRPCSQGSTPSCPGSPQSAAHRTAARQQTRLARSGGTQRGEGQLPSSFRWSAPPAACCRD